MVYNAFLALVFMDENVFLPFRWPQYLNAIFAVLDVVVVHKGGGCTVV